MLYSHSLEDDKLNLFVLFLNHLLKGNEKYKTTVDEVISEAHDLAVDKKNLYSIDRSLYQIIVFLKNKEPEFFADLDTNSLDKTVYQKVFDIIKSKSVFDVAE